MVAGAEMEYLSVEVSKFAHLCLFLSAVAVNSLRTGEAHHRDI